MQVDWARIRLFLYASILGVLAGWYGQPLIHENKDASDVIVNVFSILAGFLVTIMTLLGDPSLFGGRTWRSDAVKRSNVYQRLVRHKWLFIGYLTVLGLLFVAALVGKNNPHSIVVIWLERVYLGIAAFAFMLSLVLPSRLMSLQLARFDEMVASRRKGGDGGG